MRYSLSPTQSRLFVTLLVIVVVLGTMPMVAVAQTESAGATVVVADGETVENVEALAGSVIVEDGGTVTGDLSAFAGDVRVLGSVEGDVSVAAGNVEITGDVGGDVSAASGNIVVAEGATIAGSLNAAAGTIQLLGAIDGDVNAYGDPIVLGDDAAIGGDLTYDGSLEGNTDAVAGEITQDSSLGPSMLPNVQPIASWLFALYALALNLLLGAILLVLFPRFSAGVAERVATSPLRTGLAGLAVLVGVPILLIAVAITVIGIPITIVGAFLFALVAWIGVVYGRFAVAAWILSAVGVDNRWLALVVGLVAGAILSQVPWVGGLVNFLVFLLGLGALSVGLYAHRRGRGSPEPATATTQPASD